MSDTVVVMNNGDIQQIGSPVDIYNEPKNAFVADFIGESNILNGMMVKDLLVEINGHRFECVDTGFGENKPVDVVIRPEEFSLLSLTIHIFRVLCSLSRLRVCIMKCLSRPMTTIGLYIRQRRQKWEVRSV